MWYRLAALGAALLVGCTSKVAVPFLEPAAAVVDGHSIPMRAYRERLEVSRHRDPIAGLEAAQPSPLPPERLEDFTIEQLVREEIVRQEAERRGLRVSEGEVDARLSGLRSQAGTAAFEAALARNGFSPESFRAFERALLREVALVNRLARDRAQAAEDALSAGRSFATVAGQWSDDAGTSLRGGDAGWLAPQDLPEPELAAAVTGLPAGGRTRVVRTQRGFVLASVLERREVEIHLAVILVLAPAVELYSGESQPGWFDRWVKDRRDALAAAGRLELKVGSQSRG